NAAVSCGTSSSANLVSIWLVSGAEDEVRDRSPRQLALPSKLVAPGRTEVNSIFSEPVEGDILHVATHLRWAALSVKLLQGPRVLAPDLAQDF
ncbi:MAG: hypothetical protein ACKOW5_15920, partial [Actinomycetales bacterium]